ncbi:DUF4124 domain-containing protein [Oleiagrimonas soli]|uniref:DUF4124 domain-containing protein n=1 Tax=Oleiagrimonas soli TaxID=1543381 RepID=A0A099CVR7_9GAMM|nr:DUF4124 domain-containing protein [Oleiagrimonas soli]KGI77120.1 hypothetical protein LF63_0112820 [Oleiagrimonas soli]MBB6185341.1 hypothetical protein [Oleiagrimonas soli]
MLRLALILVLLTLASVCHAQSAVHHCVSADGTPVFTDQPCGSMQAARIGAVQPSSSRTEHACPATREALRQRVAAAFVAHDANALAGLMLWQGYGDVEAVQEVARMHRLMQHPLLNVTDGADTSPPSAQPLSAMPPVPDADVDTTIDVMPDDDLEVHLGGVEARESGPVRFQVVTRAGCYWLLP